jgi:hypothetical protein
VNVLMLMASVEGQVFGMRFHAQSVSQNRETSATQAGIMPTNE